MLKYCKKCLQPNTRPNVVFSDYGTCPICVYTDEIKNIDWEERFQILLDLVARYKNRSKRHAYDCIVGVSGGKDSTRQALFIRDKLGLRPLLVCSSYPASQVSDIGVNNLSNLIEMGFDVIISAPSPVEWKKLIRESFFKFTNWARSAELSYFSSVPRIAINYGIKLIIWGENTAIQVGDISTLGKNGYDANNLRNSNTLSSGHTWMLNSGYLLKKITPYIFPTISEYDNANLNVIFLGWFLGDWSLKRNAAFSSVYGLQHRHEPADITGDIEGFSNLDEDWHLMNQMIKYYKFGFGKVTESVCERIRAGEISRQEGINLIERFDGKCGKKYIDSFCDYIGINEEVFWRHVKKSVNKSLFEIKSGVIVPKFRVGTNGTIKG